MTGLYIVLGILVIVCALLVFAAVKPRMKKYKVIEVKPKKKRTAKKTTKRKGKYLQIRIL